MAGILRVGVAGAGVFAGYHANKVVGHSRARLSGIFDVDLDRAGRLARKYGCMVFDDMEAMAAQSDAIIIAVPATHHAQTAVRALKAGAHLLVEKPLATSLDDASRIAAIAAERGLVVQVGHQERIVAQSIGLDGIDEKPIAIEASRMSGRTERNLDTSVVMDLMIHDIDLVQWLLGFEPEQLTSDCKRFYSDHWDEAEASLDYKGCDVRLRASRNAETARHMVLTYPSGTVRIDFSSKRLEDATSFDLNPDFGDDPCVQDSLATAFDHFVKACLDGAPPLASAKDGVAAVRTALRIEGTL